MGRRQKGRKALKLILALSMCLTMLTQEISVIAAASEPTESQITGTEASEATAQQSADTPADTSASSFDDNAENEEKNKPQSVTVGEANDSDIKAGGTGDRLDLTENTLPEATESLADGVTKATENAPLYQTEGTEQLKLTAQQAIDALPDTTAEDFAVTAENVDGYKTQLVDASDAIAAYMQAGGTEDQLDFTRFDALSTAIADFDGGVAATAEKMTSREYIISLLENGGVTVAKDISDTDLNKLIQKNARIFAMVTIPTDTIKDLTYLPNLFQAVGTYIQCFVTVPKEFSYADVHAVFPTGIDGGRNKKISIQYPIYNIEDPYFETNGIDFIPAPAELIRETDPLEFVDAIPATYYLPVLPVFHDKNEFDVCLDVEGVDDPVGKGVTVTRDEITIKVEIDPSFSCSLLANPNDPFSVRTTYSIKLYSKVGADGKTQSQNGCSPIIMTPINVKYSVSLEPITAGAKDGTPTLTGYENSAQVKYPTYSQYPGETAPGRPLANSATNINRGTNTASDSAGSNNSGADIRGASNGNGTFTSSTYTAGSGADPDKIAEEKLFAGTVNGTRTTGFANYGEKGLSVANNADTGYEVDYYEAQVFHPVTGDAVGWVQKDGTVAAVKTKLTEEQMNSYLSGTGISGKTKLYVAYKAAASFTKTDDMGNPLTAALVGAQNLPSFVLYRDAACTQYAIDSDMNGTATKDENTFYYDQSTGTVSSPGIPNLPATAIASKTYYFKETAPGFAEDGKVYSLFIDKDGKITYDTSEGFIKTGEAYSLPNTPLPVSMNFMAATTLDGKADKFAAEQFKFVMKQTAAPAGVTKFIPDSGIEVYNKADGSIDFDHVMTFLTPGNYTFTVKEDASYRKAGLSEKDYQDFVFDETERTINVTVRWADTNAGDAATENGLKAIVSVQKGTEAASVVGSALGKDTNTVSAGTVTPNTLNFDTKMKIENTHKALAASTTPKTGDNSPIVQYVTLMLAVTVSMIAIADVLRKEKKNYL